MRQPEQRQARSTCYMENDRVQELQEREGYRVNEEDKKCPGLTGCITSSARRAKTSTSSAVATYWMRRASCASQCITTTAGRGERPGQKVARQLQWMRHIRMCAPLTYSKVEWRSIGRGVSPPECNTLGTTHFHTCCDPDRSGLEGQTGKTKQVPKTTSPVCLVCTCDKMPPDGAWVPNGWLRGAYMQQQKPGSRCASISTRNEWRNVVAGDLLFAAL